MPTVHTPVNKPRWYDGNGKDPYAKLEKLKDQQGWRNMSHKSSKIANLQDSSVTKQLSEIESLKQDNLELRKENKAYLDLVKDMDKRLRAVEDKKETK